MTATALRLYLIGLPFAAIDLLLVYAFYARQDTLTPALIGVLSLVVYMLTAITLHEQYGLFSLMIADSLKHITHAVVSGYLLQRRLRGLGGQRLILTLLKTCAAALAMSLIAFLSAEILSAWLTASGWGARFLGELAVVSLGLGVGGVVFLGLAIVLNIDELRWLVGLVVRKLRS
jgi:putative peptidoglycan lipid II flippase